MSEIAGAVMRGADGRLYVIREDGVERVEAERQAPAVEAGNTAPLRDRRAADDPAMKIMVTSASASRSWRVADDPAMKIIVTNASASRSWRAPADGR